MLQIVVHDLGIKIQIFNMQLKMYSNHIEEKMKKKYIKKMENYKK